MLTARWRRWRASCCNWSRCVYFFLKVKCCVLLAEVLAGTQPSVHPSSSSSSTHKLGFRPNSHRKSFYLTTGIFSPIRVIYFGYRQLNYIRRIIGGFSLIKMQPKVNYKTAHKSWRRRVGSSGHGRPNEC